MNLEMDLSIYSVARFLIVPAETRLGLGKFGGIFIRERFQNEHPSFVDDPHNVARDLVEDAAPALVEDWSHLAVDSFADG